MSKKVFIVIGCDTDPDRLGFLDNVPRDTLTWHGMLEGIPRLKESVGDIKDSNGNKPRLTWCLRADEQVKQMHGSYNAVIKKNKQFFLNLEADGDELAWHPHFFTFDKNSNKWYQEFLDTDWQIKMLENAYAEYQEVLPGRAESVRMGWVYHNNNTIATLDRLGIKVDFSGLPGLGLLPKKDTVKSVNFYDWSVTPNHPYYPSKTDYRIPATNGAGAYAMLELPNFVSHSLFWSMLSGLFLAKKMKNLSHFFKSMNNPSYWITITGKPNLFAPLSKQLSKELQQKDSVYFVTYFHPDELLPNNSTLYSLDFFRTNLLAIIETARQHRADIKFITAGEAPATLS